MPQRLLSTHFWPIVDSSIIASSIGVVGASLAGIQVDLAAMMMAISGLLIAIGRTAVYLATAYKITKEAQSIAEQEESA